MKLYAHQERIIQDDPKRCGLWLGTGSGKTILALYLARGKTLVVCPKQQREDCTWEKNLEITGLDITLTVISKEQFRSEWMDLPRFDTVIIDEAHEGLLGVTPSVRYKNRVPHPKTSQLFEVMWQYLSKHNPKRVYLVTATPIRTPMTVWAAGVLLGRWSMDSFFKFRDRYYIPMPTARNVYLARKDKETQERLGKVVRKLGYTGKLDDYFDVPDQTFRDEYVGLTKEQERALSEIPLRFPDPLVGAQKQYQIEQGFLIYDEEITTYPELYTKKLLDYFVEFDRIFILAFYTWQVQHIATCLGIKKIATFVLEGKTKDRDTIIQQANSANGKCAFIAQADVTSGYELPTFSTVVFVSTSRKFVNYVQACGRTLRANALKKNLYIRLITGEQSRARLKAIDNKEDFHLEMYAKEKGTTLS